MWPPRGTMVPRGLDGRMGRQILAAPVNYAQPRVNYALPAVTFEAVIKSVHAWGYFGRRAHGEREVMVPSSNFWVLFSNARAGVRPSVGMRVRGHVAPPQNKAVRWWLT